jgi:hypothetical protein
MPAKIKQWLQDRWLILDESLNGLTVDHEDQIKQICEDEIEYWRNVQGLGLGTLGNTVSQTRKHLLEHFSVLDATNSWLNPKEGKQEHISTKYMNLSKEEWAARMAPTQERKEARNQDRQFLNDPDAIVARAVSLLDSRYWQDIAVSLAVLTGRRVTEVLVVGSFSPHTRFTVTFKGQLKTREKIMPPYEIPVLCEASLVLAAVDRLRSLVGGAAVDENQLGEVAETHFAGIVPPRSGGNLYTHLFRSVYGCIAVLYFCKPEILDQIYLNRIYGQYWVTEATGQLQADYAATQHYQDYAIADAVIAAHNGQRQGVKLDDPGVEVLTIFQEKPEITTRKGRKMTKKDDTVTITKGEGQTEYSMIKPRKTTKVRVDTFIQEEKITDSSPYDAALNLLLDRSYMLKTITGYGVNLESIAALLGLAAAAEDGILDALVTTLKNVESIAALVAAAAKDNADDPVGYLAEQFEARRKFKASYKDRVAGRDYASMSLSQLRDNKTIEAAYERFGRAVAAIMVYNDNCAPDARWYINASIVAKLVGGKPAVIEKYLAEHKATVDAHHAQYTLTPGYNRRTVHPIYRIAVPENPGQPADLQAQIAAYEEKEKARQLARAGKLAGETEEE